MPTFKITIIRERRPIRTELNEELQWFCSSLGLFSTRDKDRSMFRIFIELLKSARAHQPLTSDQLAYKTELTRGTVIHHINKLIESGLVINDRNTYLLRVDNLEVLIDEVEQDITGTLRTMRSIAKKLDHELGL
jgi:predicted transcriptional regulator